MRVATRQNDRAGEKYEFSHVHNEIINPLTFQWKKKTEKHRAAIKFKAAARIARVTHDLSTSVKSTNDVSETIEETDENMG